MPSFDVFFAFSQNEMYSQVVSDWNYLNALVTSLSPVSLFLNLGTIYIRMKSVFKQNNRFIIFFRILLEIKS